MGESRKQCGLARLLPFALIAAVVNLSDQRVFDDLFRLELLHLGIASSENRMNLSHALGLWS